MVAVEARRTQTRQGVPDSWILFDLVRRRGTPEVLHFVGNVLQFPDLRLELHDLHAGTKLIRKDWTFAGTVQETRRVATKPLLPALNVKVHSAMSWRGGELHEEVSLSVVEQAGGGLRRSLFGASGLSQDDAEELVETIAAELFVSPDVWLSRSGERATWTAANNAQLIKKLAQEIRRALPGDINVHGYWTDGLVHEPSDRANRGNTATPVPMSVRGPVRDFSDGGSFSLRAQMSSIGVSSIDDLYTRLSAARADPSRLGVFARSLASISSDDDLGRVLARMMFACSKVETVSDSQGAARLKAQLELGGIEGPQDVVVGRFAVTAVLAGIDEARRSGLGGRCVTALQSIAPIWCNDLPAGEDRLGGTNGRQWVTAAVIVYLAELTASSELAADMIAESLMGGTAVGKREQIRLAWAYGRSWAEANGIDFDDYVRRSM